VAVWRRDAFLEATGLSSEAVDPDVDLMRRLTDEGLGNALVVQSGEIFGQAEALPMGAVLSAAREQAAASSLLNLRPVVPVAQGVVVATLLLGTALGWFTLLHLMTGLWTLAMGQAAVTSAALLMRGASAKTPEFDDLLRLVLVAPLETFLYGPRLAVARLVSTTRG
jgi:hypothetical protein